MKSYASNPRQISRAQFERLRDTLARLGDLSGIVHDLNSDQIIGGNQRARAFDINQCEIVLTEQYEQPDVQGTVAHGYVVWQGAKYAYRQVRWTLEQCAEANVTANIAGGDFDWDILANSFDAKDLIEWGFDADLMSDWRRDVGALNALLESEKPPMADAEPEFDRAQELLEKWGVHTGDMFGLGKFTHCPKCGKIHNLDGQP